MKTLIVAGNPYHAQDLRRQVRDDPLIRVIQPGEFIGARFDLIIVTDTYRRELYYSSAAEQDRRVQWFEEAVRCRLGSPEAKLIHL